LSAATVWSRNIITKQSVYQKCDFVSIGLAELGAEESFPQIREQIANALNAFRGALNYHSPDDFSKKRLFEESLAGIISKALHFPHPITLQSWK